MQAFRTLSDARTIGFSGVNPISVSEVLAYLELRGIASRVRRLKYLHLIQKLDRAFMEHVRETAPKDVGRD